MKALLLALALGLAALGLGPLHQAAHQGDIDAIKQLISEGMDPDTRDARGLTALHYAILQGKIDAIRALLDSGADVGAGIDPELAPKPEPGQEPPEKLPKSVNGITPLQLAAIQGKIKAMKALIKAGADINARNAQKLTALHLAIGEGRLEVARFLLDEGADPEAVDRRNRSPLATAALRGHLDIASLLIDAGADPDARTDGKLNTALSGSMMARNPEMARRLIDLGARIDLRTTDNSDYLSFAAMPGGSAEIVRILLKAGADPKNADDDGYTALHRATSALSIWPPTDQRHKKVSETVAILIEAGTEVDARTKEYNETALHRAIIAGYTDAARLLLDAGADPLIKTAEGKTAMDLAEQHEHDEVIPLIRQALNR